MYFAVCHEQRPSQRFSQRSTSWFWPGSGQEAQAAQEPQFKLYQNTIYDSAERPDSFSINVLWPIIHVKGKRQTIRLTSNTTEHTSVIRSWNGTQLNSLRWSFTGSSIYVLLERYNLLVTAPIIFMDAENKAMLPYNSNLFSPNEIKSVNEQEMSYVPARVFRTDPNSPENTSPIPGMSQVIRPSAPPSAAPTAAPVAIVRASTNQPASLPVHIIKIVLADSIRKNDVCPITSDTITETNATVTVCGHVFTTAAITHWLSLPSSRGLCPVCKQKC